MSRTYLDFERSVAELESKISDLQQVGSADVDVSEEIAQLCEKSTRQLEQLYKNIGAWEKTQVARHPGRPHFSEYVEALISDYSPLAGDRKFGDDHALLGGLGRIGPYRVMVMGHEKGKNTETRLKHNFGMAQPEGYRKAVRLMDMAERFSLPVISFVDTAGAFPGRGAEERGQAEAIARCTDRGLSLSVPFISVITGEGGSGGAVAIATANKVMMLEHSIYSVISPEGCASILWRDNKKAQDAAKAMKITAQDLKDLGVIDHIVKEPIGGAHRQVSATIKTLGDDICAALDDLVHISPDDLIQQRREKFLHIGRSLL